MKRTVPDYQNCYALCQGFNRKCVHYTHTVSALKCYHKKIVDQMEKHDVRTGGLEVKLR